MNKRITVKKNETFHLFKYDHWLGGCGYEKRVTDVYFISTVNLIMVIQWNANSLIVHDIVSYDGNITEFHSFSL